MACLLFPARVDAQEAEPDPVRVTLHGVVYDALTGTPVPGAAVYLQEKGQGVLSDSRGIFRFDDIAAGPQTVAALQFGYEEMAAAVDVPEDGAFVEVELTPQPIMVDGVTAVVDNISTMEKRLLSRRLSVPYQTRAFDQERLLRSASGTVFDFLSFETRFTPIPCPDGVDLTWDANPTEQLGWNLSPRAGGLGSSRCIMRRGRFVSPRVYIDELPVIGGLDAFEGYPTTQIYALEVFSQGAEIRAYTYAFMQRMAEMPVALVPIDLWPEVR